MSLFAYNHGITFEVIEPSCCNVPFMMSTSHYNTRVKDHKAWYCPNCGSNRVFNGESEEAKLKKQLDTERTTNNFLRKQNEKERNRTRAQKG